MFTKMQFQSIFKRIIVLTAITVLFSACTPLTSTPTATSGPIVTQQPAATIAPEATQVPVLDNSLNFSLDTGSIASGYQTETVAALTDADNVPNWEVLPAYTKVTLQDYPVGGHLMKPQIFIYPLNELAKVNEGAGMIINSLQTLLQSPQEIQSMPFLPLFNAHQVMHVQIQYLDFKSGQGVRYVTEFDQAFVPVNNHELFYTYQGLTGDGKYYVAAVLPLNHPDLPLDGTVTGNEPPEFTSDFPAYLANVVNMLDSQAANSFTPDLTQLDAIMSSLEIK